ncbi:MAG: hypothetical protein KA749_02840, partial [Acidovorax sp.]|nr:hypothetical protein [Acidovorax sp.]
MAFSLFWLEKQAKKSLYRAGTGARSKYTKEKGGFSGSKTALSRTGQTRVAMLFASCPNLPGGGQSLLFHQRAAGAFQGFEGDLRRNGA